MPTSRVCATTFSSWHRPPPPGTSRTSARRAARGSKHRRAGGVPQGSSSTRTTASRPRRSRRPPFSPQDAPPGMRPSSPAPGDRMRLRLDARYVGPQYLRGDEENVERRLSDYAVVDASLDVEVGRYRVRVAVPNVLDRRYVTFGTFAANPTVAGDPVQRFLTPGLPRHVLVSLSAEF